MNSGPLGLPAPLGSGILLLLGTPGAPPPFKIHPKMAQQKMNPKPKNVPLKNPCEPPACLLKVERISQLFKVSVDQENGRFAPSLAIERVVGDKKHSAFTTMKMSAAELFEKWVSIFCTHRHVLGCFWVDEKLSADGAVLLTFLTPSCRRGNSGPCCGHPVLSVSQQVC